MPPSASRPSNLESYLKSQLTAAVATGVDFTVYVLTVELVSVWYVLGVGLGAAAGGVTAFILNRQWSFLAGHEAVVRERSACERFFRTRSRLRMTSLSESPQAQNEIMS